MATQTERAATRHRLECLAEDLALPRDVLEVLLGYARRTGLDDEDLFRGFLEQFSFSGRGNQAPIASAATPPYVVVGADTFAVKKFDAREYIQEPYYLEKNIGMFHGWRGTGKTAVAVGVSLATSTGGQFLRWRSPKARRVLYIDGELPAETLQKRIVDVARASKLAYTDNLRILTPDLQPEGLRIPNLADPAGQQIIDEIIERENPEVVVFDNLSTLCRSGEENDAAPWQVMQDWLVSLRSRRRSPLLIHHDGKGGDQRGTSKREDVLDFSIQLKRPANYQEEEGARFEVHFRKARDQHGQGIEAFEAWLRGDYWAMKSVKTANDEQIRSMLAEGMNAKDIARELGVHFSTVYRIKKRGGEA
ncbi:MAG TPA: AAA family ATPase [Thermoanaerobaculia bacterium]|nr:AAA family ATPase [Thermoanaerobaculia bacterium]